MVTSVPFSAELSALRVAYKRQAHLIDTLTEAVSTLRTGVTALKADNTDLRGELEQGLLVVRLDNREAVRILVGKDRPEHDHVATLEVGAPMGSVAAHDLAL